jgi:hypothetical protein
VATRDFLRGELNRLGEELTETLRQDARQEGRQDGRPEGRPEKEKQRRLRADPEIITANRAPTKPKPPRNRG